MPLVGCPIQNLRDLDCAVHYFGWLKQLLEMMLPVGY